MSETQETRATPLPRKLRFHFSLRTLILLISIGGVTAGWLGQRYIARIRSPEYRLRQYDRFQPRVLSNVGGKHTCVSFADCGQMTDEDLEFISLMTQVGYDIARIECVGANINGSGLKYLKHAPNLELLDLAGTHVTSESLIHVAPLRHIYWLSLEGTQVTDEGLASLAKLSQLRVLVLGETAIGDEGLRKIAHLHRLEHLFLGKTNVTDVGLAHLSEMKALDWLDLRDTEVTDDGLPLLYACAALRSVRLAGTKCTPTGVARLERALPRCSPTLVEF